MNEKSSNMDKQASASSASAVAAVAPINMNRVEAGFQPGTRILVRISSIRQLPDFLQSVNLKYVKLGYHYLCMHAVVLLFIPLLVAVGLEVGRVGSDDLAQMWESLRFNLVSVFGCSTLLVFAVTAYFMSRPRPIFLVDHACYLPPAHLRVFYKEFIDRSRASGYFDERSMEFQEKILERSGLSEHTCLPEALHAIPQQINMRTARKESEDVMFGCLDELFEKTGVKPKDIGILVVNCSLFCPTPSLSAMIVNKYKMRGNVRTFNLGGMGCSASVIAVDLAKDLLKLHGNTYAVVVSTENITQNWYFGNRRSMLIPNCLFRVGGAAVLLSNKRSDKWRSKYKLNTIVRTHKGADDKSHACVYQEEDEKGRLGVTLSKELMAIAGQALKANITTLGPMVLPLSEQLLFFAHLVGQKLFNMKKLGKAYIPDFRLAFEHFCIHAGGRGVIDELQKNLNLSELHCEASRMTLYRFGNTSSSSIWYELAYLEAKGRMRRGDRVWQIAFGSGFKCNSAVWQALRTIQPPTANHSPWMHCIHEYPVKIPQTQKYGMITTPSPTLL